MLISCTAGPQGNKLGAQEDSWGWGGRGKTILILGRQFNKLPDKCLGILSQLNTSIFVEKFISSD